MITLGPFQVVLLSVVGSPLTTLCDRMMHWPRPWSMIIIVDNLLSECEAARYYRRNTNGQRRETNKIIENNLMIRSSFVGVPVHSTHKLTPNNTHPFGWSNRIEFYVFISICQRAQRWNMILINPYGHQWLPESSGLKFHFAANWCLLWSSHRIDV